MCAMGFRQRLNSDDQYFVRLFGVEKQKKSYIPKYTKVKIVSEAWHEDVRVMFGTTIRLSYINNNKKACVFSWIQMITSECMHRKTEMM